ncbi:hypothetical protein ACIBCN_02135 [Nocardia sp. NPDC051052]|uniref:hypothetical protein n=1 Tax=Nocardia sp. NPDC051052 TaxID=3364322 RepID=UPI0037AB19BF
MSATYSIARRAVGFAAIAFTMFTVGAGEVMAAPVPAAPAVQFVTSYPEVEADADGKPRMECNQFHDGERVSTSGGERKFICNYHDPIFGKGYWIWTELMLAG